MTTALRAGLDRWDANEDGVIDAREFLTYFRGQVALFQAGTLPSRSSSPGGGGRAASATGLPAWLMALDTNRDGQVALHEWRAAGRPVSEFQRLDRNGDGFLTPREVASASPSAVSAVSQASDPLRTGVSAATGTSSATGFSAGMLVNGPTPASAARATPADQMEKQHVAAAAASPRPAAVPAKAAAARPTPSPAPPPPALPAATTASPINNGTSAYWTMREQQNEQRLEAGPAEVLFLGDSITDFLADGAGQSVWDTWFAPLGAEDFAIGGLTTSQVLWQVQAGEVALAAPRVVVLMIGTNNLGGGQSPQDTAAGIAKIVAEMQTQLPKTQILLLGLLPRGQSPDDPLRAKVAQVNTLIAGLEGKGVTFLDVGADFLQSDGTLSPRVMPDFLHPSLLGYQIYTAAIWETLTSLLAES